MQQSRLISQLDFKSNAIELAPLLAEYVSTSKSPGEFLNGVLPHLLSQLNLAGCEIHRATRGRWKKIAQAGDALSISEDILSQSLDTESSQTRGRVIATPLDPSNQRSELLVVMSSEAVDSKLETETTTAAGLLELNYRLVREKEGLSRAVTRSQEILQIAMQWNQSDDSQQLLVDIAEASTRLLNSERASIFLWNKPKKELLAYPALGVNDELRLPDDVGVVGQVIQTGETRRVDADATEQQAEIDREIDKQLDFQTSSLLCVPLTGRKGKLLGAFEMINKIGGNFDDVDEETLCELAAHAAVAIENSQHFELVVAKQQQMVQQAAEGVQLIGDSPAMAKLCETIERVANTDLAVLVLGENGTGKEVVSNLIHYHSQRRNELLVAVNCAAISETLLESELFGHEKGAFTDAHEARAGKFELATGGTLFLDEIGDMSAGGQAKLLRVLEEKVVVRVGGSIPIPTDVRVCAATNQDLSELVKQKKFREDLFFRLNVVTLNIPPLRERGNDVILLSETFLQNFCVKARREPLTLTPPAKKKLVAHSWPGNVRELRNIMERLAYLSESQEISADDISFSHSATREESVVALDQKLTDATRAFQVDYINRQIESTGGNITEAAKRLGMHRSNLYRKMKQLGFDAVDEE